MCPTVSSPSRTAHDLLVRTRKKGNTLWIELRGEIDLASHDRLQSRLDSVVLDAVDLVELDLSALTFCDVRGLCHLLVLARRARTGGRSVVARDAADGIRRMTRLLGCDELVRFE